MALDAAAEKYMDTLPVKFRGIFKHAKADKQKALMEKVEVRSDRILFNVTVKGEEKILDVPRLNTQLEEAPQS
ncbi:hypothetical protein KA478_00195 [Patescibacteria group bacterium]|nr:hypothetical protein [Patescibacteria group bacterium]